MSRMTIKDRLEALVPPGSDWRIEVRVYLIALGACALMSFLTTVGSVYQAYRGLFDFSTAYLSERYRLSDRMMPRFTELCWTLPLFVGIMAGLCTVSAVGHWRSFSMESHTLYLMRRLPTRGELFRRVALLPILGMVLALGVLAVLYSGYYLFYIQITPAGHLPI